MSDALEVLRAKVEAATPGEWKIWHKVDHTNGVTWVTDEGENIAECCHVETYEHDAALIVAAVNLAKRLCTDERVEAMARAYENAAFSGQPDEEGEDWDAKGAAEAMRAAIRAIIGEQP